MQFDFTKPFAPPGSPGGSGWATPSSPYNHRNREEVQQQAPHVPRPPPSGMEKAGLIVLGVCFAVALVRILTL